MTERSEATDKRPRRNVRGRLRSALRLTSLRLRLVTVFALVALVAAVSVAGIAYWLNRDAVLTRVQDAALEDFRTSLGERASSLPPEPTCDDLRRMATRMTSLMRKYQVVITNEGAPASDQVCTAASDPSVFTIDMVPETLVNAVRDRRDEKGQEAPFHVYWQRIDIDGDPYLVAGSRVLDDGPTGYMLAPLSAERDDLNSLAWSLGIATALAVVGSVLLAQAAATTVLRPVQRLNDAARRLSEGKLDTRLPVRGADELAQLTRTFNSAAESLERRVQELSGREEASRRFVADMSHELRTPMTAITAVTEVLEDEVDSLDPMIAPAVQLVVSETRRLNVLVENLMEVTRFDAGTARMVLDDVDIADQVTHCIDDRAWLDAVQVSAERGIIARVDPRRLDVILANLIGNALKHGGSPVRVAVREEERQGRQELVIEVADQGPGIPEDVLPHVFDRFYKASASRPRSEGSGLGLSIALENAHLHGGEISAHNSPEGGAVFTLRLPRVAQPPEDVEGENGNGTGGNGTGGNGTGGNGNANGSSNGSRASDRVPDRASDRRAPEGPSGPDESRAQPPDGPPDGPPEDTRDEAQEATQEKTHEQEEVS